MTLFERLMILVKNFMDYPINLDGFEFTPWGLMVFVAVATIAMKFLHDIFS